jgi:hypothetical protein
MRARRDILRRCGGVATLPEKRLHDFLLKKGKRFSHASSRFCLLIPFPEFHLPFRGSK